MRDKNTAPILEKKPMAKSAMLRTHTRGRPAIRREHDDSAKKRPTRRPRDAAATSDRILEAAIMEFAEHGYAGARIDAIAQRGDANMRMLYHYFGSKNDLYVRVLETVFERIRLKEQKLNLKAMAPLPAMMKLFDFTYDHFASNPLFIRILTNENLLGGRYLSRSVRVSSLSSPLLIAMKEVLRRGEAEGVFRRGIDPLQLYVSMVAMSYFHISNGPTLSHLFSTNLSAGRWRNERRRHASEMLQAYLTMEARP
jgi:TetR/AcrR family transcriptional regulator